MALNYTVRQIFNLLSVCRLIGNGSGSISGVSTDTRSIRAGDLFVALKGEVFDANEKVADAVAKGAVAVIMDNADLAYALANQVAAQKTSNAFANSQSISILLVPNSLYALGAIAKHWRSQFNLPVIAVAGSNGKTTVKEMIASILRAQYGQGAFATQGNLNNEIGVPQTLFRLDISAHAAVIELGMNHPGEIERLAVMTMPTVGVVTNAQREHQEFMKTVEAVAYENGSVFSALPNHGVAVFPADETYSAIWQQLSSHAKTMSFGLQHDKTGPAAVWAKPTDDPQAFAIHYQGGEHTVKLSIAGRHNVKNALAAASATLAIGIDWPAIVLGLEQFRPVKGRLVSHRVGKVGLIDDSYNANPDSVLAAISVLAQQPAPRCLVLGDMGEVGDQGPQFHAEIGRAILNTSINTSADTSQKTVIEHVLLLGELNKHCLAVLQNSPNVNVKHFASMAELCEQLGHVIGANSFAQSGTVLVKGSRFMQMERAVEYVLSLLMQASVLEEAH
jgi:UDP-N-acetylmuramoyl-tripeptide--D-alanyl-D-alanine ligase